MSSKEDFLKRYTLGPQAVKTGKKKQKKKTVKPSGMVIVDETVEVKSNADGPEDGAEDVPVVVAEVEEKPQKTFQFGTRRDGSGWVVVQDPKEQTQKRASPYNSPTRNQRAAGSPSTNEANEDLSPPRRRTDEEDLSPPRRESSDTERSPSSRKTRHDEEDGDLSPPRRTRTDEEDLSPPRKENNGDLSPPRRRTTDTDLSPPRKTRSDADISPPRRRTRTDEDLSPPRRTKRTDSDLSPPRKRRTDEDLSPPRKKRREDDDDLSPPRKKTPSSSEDGGPKMMHGSKAGLITYKEIRQEEKRRKDREEARYASADPSNLGKGAQTVYRDKYGKKLSINEIIEKEQGKLKNDEEVQMEWGTGLVQKRERENKKAIEEAAKDAPFSRSIEDERLNETLKQEDRWGDPMLNLVSSKKKDKKEKKQKKEKKHKKEKKEKKLKSGIKIPTKPLWKGPPPANRFNILPGNGWDGVDRSGGYEKEFLLRESNKKATQEIAYLWSVEDM